MTLVKTTTTKIKTSKTTEIDSTKIVKIQFATLNLQLENVFELLIILLL